MSIDGNNSDTRVSQSPLRNARAATVWSQTRSEIDHHHSKRFSSGEQNRLAREFALLSLAYWRDSKPNFPKRNQPFYIIETASASGEFAYQFLIHFVHRFERLRASGDQAQYIMTSDDAQEIDVWMSNDKLSKFVKQGYLEFAHSEGGRDTQLTLLVSNKEVRLDNLDYPCVVIANRVLSDLKHTLFELEKDAVYELELTSNADETDKQNQTLYSALEKHHYRRKLISEQNIQYPIEWALLQQYRLLKAPVLVSIPHQAMEFIQRVSMLNAGNILMLSVDAGTLNLDELPSYRLDQSVTKTSFSNPVNYHALNAFVQELGGEVHCSSATNGTVVMAAWFNAAMLGAQGSWTETRLAAEDFIQDYDAASLDTLKMGIQFQLQYLSTDHMLWYLKESDWDDETFYLFYDALIKQLPSLSLAEHGRWHEVIRALWAHYFPQHGSADLAFDLACLSASMQRWKTSQFLFQQSLKFFGEHIATHCNLALCYWQSGEIHYADWHFNETHKLLQIDTSKIPLENTCEQDIDELIALVSGTYNHGSNEYGDAPESLAQLKFFLTQFRDFKNWQKQNQALLALMPMSFPNAQRSSCVYLTLLGEHHARAIYRHQRNPSLASHAGVEQLSSVEHARLWIKNQCAQKAKAQRNQFAIMHADYGLIGLISLEVPLDTKTSNCARIVYWVGEEFQRRGYGSSAIAILANLAERLNIQTLFAAVHSKNKVSQRVLEKNAYQRLSCKVLRGSDAVPLDFYCYDIYSTSASSHETSMHALYQQGSKLQNKDTLYAPINKLTEFLNALDSPLSISTPIELGQDSVMRPQAKQLESSEYV